MRLTLLAVSNDLTSSVYFLQKRLKREAKNTQNYSDNDKQEMKESKAVYVNKHKIRDDQKLVYHLTKSDKTEPFQRSDNKPSHFSCQYDSKINNEICTCKNVITVRKHQEIKYFSGLPKQIYAYHGARSFTDVGVGSVKALPKKNVKRIYLPETDDRGVGSSDLFSFITRRSRYSKGAANGSCYYDYKRTSSKCVGGILEYNTGCVINQKLSPIVQTKSRSTSPKNINELKSTEIGSNIVCKKFETIGTQSESKEPEKVEAKTKAAEFFEMETKPIKKVSEQTQKSKYSNEITEDKRPEVGKRAKDVYKNFSSDSLVQHIHDLEIPSDDKPSRSSFPDPMENKLEREYRKMFSTAKCKDSRSSFQRPLPEFKSVSLLKRRFDALRRGMHKKDSNIKKIDSLMINTDPQDSFPTHKDASVTSDPPSLISRSISNSNKYSPVKRSAEKYRNKEIIYKNEKYSEQWPQNATDSESQGVKGMFKLWGKKFNFEDETRIDGKETPMPSYNTVKKPEKVMTPNIEAPTKKEGKKFFFFKRKSKDKPSQPYKSKKNVTAGRCEIGDGLTLKFESNSRQDRVSTIPEEDNEITCKTWLNKFLSKTIESARSVNIRWNNSMYATSSSTILELLDTVYTNAGVVFKSRSEITTEDSSFYKSFTKPKVNFVRDIEAWMIPKTITDRPIKQMPAKLNSNKQKKEKNIELTISDQKWIIDRSEAFSNKIEIVVNSDSCDMFENNTCSSEYLKINIPKDFFDLTTSTETKPADPVIQKNQWSDEEVYKIVEYETNSEIERGGGAIKKLEKGDFTSHDIEVIVSLQDGNNLESKILETVIKSPMHRDVVIQGSNVNIPKRCDVVGVGIITRRDLIRNSVLKIQDVEDETDEESDTVKWPNQKKCGFAESYLQDYYRHLTPLGIDLYSWCFSDCHIRSCSEKSIISYYHLGDGSRSCPNISDDFHTATIGSSGEISPSYNNYEDLRAEPEHCRKNILKIFKKNVLEIKRETDGNDKRVLPKDSVEVFKRRKIYATSNKSRWIGSAATQDKPVGVPSFNSIDAQKHIMKKNIIASPNRAITKHVSMKQLSGDSSEGILQFKEAGCEVCMKEGFECSEHVIVKRMPSYEIPPYKASCESMKKASSSKPNSPSGNIPRQPPVSCDPRLPPCCSPQSGFKRSLGSASQNSSRVPSLSSSHIPSSSRSGSKYLGFIPDWVKNPSPGITPRRSTSPCKSPSASPRTRDTKTITFPCTSNLSPPTPPGPPTEESNATALCKMYSGPASVVQHINSQKSQLIPPASRSICSSNSKSKTVYQVANPVSPRSSNTSDMYVCCKDPTSNDCKKCCQYIPPEANSRLTSKKKKKRSSPPHSRQNSSCGSPPTDQLKKMSSPPHLSQRSPCRSPPCDQFKKKPSPPHAPQRSPEITPCGLPSCKFKKNPSPPHTPQKSPQRTTCGSYPCNKLMKKLPPPPKLPKPPKISLCSLPPCNQLNKMLSPSHLPQRSPCGSPTCDQLKEKSSPTHSAQMSLPSDQLKKKSSYPHSPQMSPACDQLKKTPSPSQSPQRSPCRPSPCAQLKDKSSPPHSPPCDQLKKNSPCPRSSPSSFPRQNQFNNVSSPAHSSQRPPCQSCEQLKKKSSSPQTPQRSPCRSPLRNQLKKESSTPLSPQKSPCHSLQRSPCRSLSSDQFKKGSSPPHSPQRSRYSSPARGQLKKKSSAPHTPQKSPCHSPYCDKAVKQEFPWPMNSQISNPPSPKISNTSPPEPFKFPNKCDKKCSMIPKEQPISQAKLCPPCPLSPGPPKISGIHLKMKSKICDDNCSAWNSSERLHDLVGLNSREQTPSVQEIRKPICQKLPDEDGKTANQRIDYCCGKAGERPDQLQSVIRLNSREQITITLKEQTPSIQEIRKPTYRKMLDEDGKTLYERKDYTNENVVTGMYRDSKINRLSTPVITNVSESKEHKGPSTTAISEQSLDNLVEIQFKLRITQGDKKEIKIGNENEEMRPEKSENCCEKPDACVVNSATEDFTGEINPKNDIDIKIVVRNYRPKCRNVEYNSVHKQFSKKISDKFNSVSTGYSNVNMDPSTEHVYSVHRATVNLSSSAEKSKTDNKISKEVPSKNLIEDEPNITVSSHSNEQLPNKQIQSKDFKENEVNFTVSFHSTEQLLSNEVQSKYFIENEPNINVSSHSTEKLPTDVTEDEITEGKSISSKKDSQSEKLEETNTNASEFPDFNDTDDQDAAELAHTSDECNVESVISKHTSKVVKKLFLKKVMKKADRPESKNKQSVRQLKDMLKVILTDSSENDDWHVSCNETIDDVTYTALNPNSFKNTDSMNNYYQQDSPVLSTRDKIEAIYPTIEDNSIVSYSNSSDSEANYVVFEGCMCSKLAEKLDQTDISCCCRQKNKKDGETNCDMKNEYVSVQVQNSKSLTPKVNSLNVSVHSKSFAKTGNIKFVDETDLINSPIVKKKKIKSFSSCKIREYKIKRLNKDTLLGISDDDKVIILCDKSRKVSGERDISKRTLDDCLKDTEILQSYEVKKAVLEIYAEKAEDGKHLVAKLPRFVAEKESEIVRNYEQIASSSYESICKENIVMSVRR